MACLQARRVRTRARTSSGYSGWSSSCSGVSATLTASPTWRHCWSPCRATSYVLDATNSSVHRPPACGFTRGAVRTCAGTCRPFHNDRPPSGRAALRMSSGEARIAREYCIVARALTWGPTGAVLCRVLLADCSRYARRWKFHATTPVMCEADLVKLPAKANKDRLLALLRLYKWGEVGKQTSPADALSPHGSSASGSCGGRSSSGGSSGRSSSGNSTAARAGGGASQREWEHDDSAAVAAGAPAEARPTKKPRTAPASITLGDSPIKGASPRGGSLDVWLHPLRPGLCRVVLSVSTQVCSVALRACGACIRHSLCCDANTLPVAPVAPAAVVPRAGACISHSRAGGDVRASRGCTCDRAP